MLLFSRRPRRDQHADPHRRRAGRRARRHSWLRLAFWLRGNRRVTPKPEAAAGVVAEDPAETLSTAHTTQPSHPAPASLGRPRRLWHTVLRIFGAVALSAGLGGAGYGARYFLDHSPSFAVRAVRVSPTLHVPAATLISRANVPLSTNLFRVDLGQVQRNLSGEPWLKSVRVRRELPATVAIDVVEYEPRALVALGPLYLTDAQGAVFKRATPEEAAFGRDPPLRGGQVESRPHLPVITGIGREAYTAARDETQELIREALAAYGAYAAGPGAPARPPIGEIHVDGFTGTTLYTTQGVAIRLGQGAPAEIQARLGRLDAVLGALGGRGQKPEVVFLNNRAHPDHVTVRLERPPSR